MSASARVDEEREEARFQAAIARSAAAVDVVADYLSREGYEVEILAQSQFVDRAIFKDAGADLRCRQLPSIEWLSVEVKARTFNFTSAATFPFRTIIIDRATKGKKLDLYFNVSRDLTHAAIVTRASERYWQAVTIFDRTKGYGATNFECPTREARFVALNNEPKIAPPAAVAVNNFFGHCTCGLPGLYFATGRWFCQEHRP